MMINAGQNIGKLMKTRITMPTLTIWEKKFRRGKFGHGCKLL
jgi:hypothetical protein